MKSRKHLLALLCLVSACAVAPSLAMAEVNVVIGVAPPVHYYSTHRYLAPQGYWQWQGPRRIWVPQHRYYGGHFQHETNRWGDHRFDSRSHWGNRNWGDRGGHDNRGQDHRGHGHDR